MNFIIENEKLEIQYIPGNGAWTYHLIIPNTKNIKGKWGDLKVSGNKFANRFRYFTSGIIPMNGSKPLVRGAFAAIQNEVFLNLGDKSNVNGKFFDQNRLYLALGYRLSSKFDLESGYLNQYVAGANDKYSRAHIVQLAVYLRL